VVRDRTPVDHPPLTSSAWSSYGRLGTGHGAARTRTGILPW
jgi:hypothetical protein